MSVARVAQAEGVNSHQVFQWRRAFRAGGLLDRSKKTAELLPVVVTADGVGQALSSQSRAGINTQPQPGQAEPGGAIHIELLGRAMIRVERGAEALMLRAVLEGLRK